MTGHVCAWVKDQDGLPVGQPHSNPLLETWEYKVEFPDGSVDALQANIIAENMFSQINSEGHSFGVLKEIPLTTIQIDMLYGRIMASSLAKQDGNTQDDDSRLGYTH
jgi:hypothetical protein